MNMVACGWARDGMRDYDRLESVAVLLLYIQIGCGVIGCLGASYNGVAAMNVCVALFALVAIESSSQRLGRIYALLLLAAILIDLLWFILFAHPIWNMSSEEHDSYFMFSVKLTLAMQMIGCSVRVLSSLLWIQMYRLGVEATASRDDLRNSFLSPPAPPNAAVARQSSGSDEVLGGSIYDPSYYSSLFEDARFSTPGQNRGDSSPRRLSAGRSIQWGDNHGNGCASSADGSPLKVSTGRSFPCVDEDKSFRT